MLKKQEAGSTCHMTAVLRIRRGYFRLQIEVAADFNDLLAIINWEGFY